MNRQVFPGPVRGRVAAIPSKSDVHRLLIGALLADGPTRIPLSASSRDIEATVRCIRALGAQVEEEPDALTVRPGPLPGEAALDCGESGSTLRFLLPVVAALGVTAHFTGSGRLPERPMAPLTDQLRRGGAAASGDCLPLTVSGRLRGGKYALPGDISSQYFTGLLFALPLLPEDSTLSWTSPVQSAGYLALTESALTRYGIRFSRDGSGWRLPGGQRYHSPGAAVPEGDWSGAAFWLAAGALAGPLTVTGLREDSPQGDREMAPLLARFGARVQRQGDAVTVSPGPLWGISIDAAQIPDLVPILAVVAACAQGDTVISGAQRLRLKESDRLATTRQLLTALGVSVRERPDGLIIHGGPIHGGTVDGAGDHRIVMAAAIAALRASDSVTIQGAEAVEKSYPDFFRDFQLVTGGTRS